MMKPTWALTTLGFVAGTVFGALALGDLGAPVAVSTMDTIAGDGTLAEVSEPGLVQTLKAASGPPPSETSTQGAAAPVEDPRIAAMMASWRSAEARIADLQSRLASVERTLAERLQAEGSERPGAPQSADDRRDVLVAAGVNPALAEDIVWRESRIELDRLNLRDQASREGWMGSDRYREALDALAREGGPLREEIGDAAWDRYLYLTGEDNRVGVSSVIPGSAAEAAGLQAGDVIESYAGGQPFGFNDLRRATTEGEKGELVAVRVRRGGRVFDAWVPRGPLGVRLKMTRAEPLE
jgi:hypothetical protein